MSGDGPRIDLYGLAAGDAPNELVLTHTLSVTEGGRYSIRAHVVPATGGAGWVVTSFGEVIAHRARR